MGMDGYLKRHILMLVTMLAVSFFVTEGLWSLSFRGRTPKINNAQFLLDQEVIISETIRVNHKGQGTDFFITFSTGQSGQFANRYLLDPVSGGIMYYQVYDNAADRRILVDLSAGPSLSQVLSGSFSDAEAAAGGGTTKDLTFVVILDPDQFPLAGQYAEELRLELWAGTPDNPRGGGPEDTAIMSMSAQMDQVMDISLVPSGGSFDSSRTELTLDFGELYAGSRRHADLMVRANSGYSVYMRSQNSGVMMIQDVTDTSSVPYSLSVAGGGVDLSSGTDVPVVPLGGPSTIRGDRYDVGVEIEDFGMATEGFYTDMLIITVAAQ